MAHGPSDPVEAPKTLRDLWGVVRSAFSQTPRVVRLVLQADPTSAIGIIIVGLVGALVPLAIAYVGKLLVDGVLLAMETQSKTDQLRALTFVGIEFGLMILAGFLARLSGLLRTLLGTKLGYLINIRILEKALTLDLVHFENPDVYDKMQRARREASARPLNLFLSSVGMVTNAVTLLSYAAVLFTFSGWTLLILLSATVPAFLVEAKYSGQAYRLFSWRAPEGRKMRYLELILTRDSHTKEVKLYRLGSFIMDRYRALYRKFYGEERSLAVRRSFWGFVLGVLSTVALYGCYVWIVARTINGPLSLGDMTMYIAVFRQGQGAVQTILKALGSTYEDNLFMSNLFAYLSIPTKEQSRHAPLDDRSGDKQPDPAPKPATEKTGFSVENVSFRYPGTNIWALEKVTLTIGPEERLAIVGENGAGKTTLIKLLTGLYRPTEGRILLDGQDVESIPEEELRKRFGVVLQDFVRYQFKAGENVGLGFPSAMDDRPRVEKAAEQGGADEVIEELPERYDQQLGRWFEGGVDLSLGNWQKIAVSRAFMRDADILILDEPTAALDAEAEHALFERFGTLTAGKMALLISHRFSTVRMADRIIVLSGGEVQEVGTHAELLAQEGRYAHLFRLQARGYLPDEPLAAARDIETD